MTFGNTPYFWLGLAIACLGTAYGSYRYIYHHVKETAPKAGRIVAIGIAVGIALLTIFASYLIWCSGGDWWEIPLPLFALLGMTTGVDAFLKKVPNALILFFLYVWLGVLLVRFVVQGISFVAVFDIALGLVGALFAAIIFFAVYFASKKQIGGGDVKFGILLGLYLQASDLLSAVFMGCLLCMLFALTGCALKKLTMKAAIPFTPFLALGTLLTIFLNYSY